ncbi:MAG: FAD-dependent oxidoreductase, partial [Chloroflexota bacterium]
LEGNPPMVMPEGRRCTVNPSLLREREFALKPAPEVKRVIVIGGGLAGMEAAMVAAERGHRVSLYEKDDTLGGQWRIATQQDRKETFVTLIDDLRSGLEKAGVGVFLGKEATVELVKNEKPDAVVIATGAVPRSLDVPGTSGDNVVQAVDVLIGKAKVGRRVVVVGGRAVGMETALSLAKKGKMVSLVTMHRLGENGKEMERNTFRTLRDGLIEHGVYLYPDSTVREIREDGVYVVKDRDLVFLKADTVVLAVGAKSENRLVEEVKGIVSELHAIGDCVEPRDALTAMNEGAQVGRKI